MTGDCEPGGGGEFYADAYARALSIWVRKYRAPLAQQASPGVRSPASMTPPGADQPVLYAGLRASAGRDGHHYGVGAREA